MNREPHDCLIVVDVQNDFCPGGALAVPGGDEVVPIINRLTGAFPHWLLTQDWHPADHQSFAASHPSREAFESIEVDYGDQVLWPDHCIQGSRGAAFHPDLNTDGAELILRKGYRAPIDSYSAFMENDRKTTTGLAGYLHGRGFKRLFLAGLALDYCVRYSAEDARVLGFETYVITDACRAIDTAGSLHAAMEAMGACGVEFRSSQDFLP